jgi:alkylation response protein AidB-like acyl-CoA dehydrogenase
MKLDLSEGQTLIQDTVARLFADESTMARVRAAESSGGFDPALWLEIVGLGLVAMRATDPAEGGSSLLNAALVAEQAGRHLVSAPLIEAIVATALLQRAGADPAVVAEASEGTIATLALAHVAAGQAQLVPGGAVAKLILALDGDELILLRRATNGTAPTAIAASPVALIDLSSAEAGERTVVARGEPARTAYAIAVEEWKLLSAAMLAGIGRRALELAAAYSVERVQFGKPIGTFQGIAHPLADSVTDVEGAQLLVWWAIWANATGRADAAATSAMAWWWAGRAAEPATLRAVHTFGGYGVSVEYDVQLYYRRAMMVALLAGDPQRELDHIAERLLDGAGVPLPPAGEIEVDFAWGEKAEAYAAELRAFVTANMTPEVEKKKHHSTSGHHPGFHKKMAEAGYAFPDLSADGNPPRSRYEVLAAAPLWEDLNWTRVPSAVTEMVAKVAEIWSQPEAKQEILSRIIAGDALGCLGFSEPGSGSDIFAARFSAVRDGDDWVMNGQKMFTTNAHNADYIIMLTRTNNQGKKHEGLTMFIMPLKLPGVDIQPVYTLQDERTNIVYFGDVRVPDKYRLGEVDQGMKVMGSVLQLEHGGADYHYAQSAMLRHATAWARRPAGNGAAPIANPDVRRALARAAVGDAVSEVLCRRAAWADVEDIHEIAWGPMAKLFTTETLYRDGSALTAAAAPQSLVRGLDHDLDMVEIQMRRAIGMQIYGGTSEIHRSIIAEHALGMPKSRG